MSEGSVDAAPVEDGPDWADGGQSLAAEVRSSALLIGLALLATVGVTLLAHLLLPL